jgi:hypothetical protein
VSVLERLYPGITKLSKLGALSVPKQLSWRRAVKLQKVGIATVYPFSERWLGVAEITPYGREVVQHDAGADEKGTG